MDNRRKFTRFNLGIEAEIQNKDKLYRTEVLDISLKGILVNSSSFVGELGENYVIQIVLSPEIIMTFNSLLVHQENTNFGFKFMSQSLDSLSHLRSLLEFNSDDPDMVQEELFFLRQ